MEVEEESVGIDETLQEWLIKHGFLKLECRKNMDSTLGKYGSFNRRKDFKFKRQSW